MSIGSFFQKLVPKETKFFPLFEALADLVIKASEVQLEVFEYADPTKQKDLLKQINLLRSKADEIEQKLYDELANTFITPFDREDIQALTNTMASVLGFINKVALQIRHFKPEKTPVEFKNMAILIQKGATLIKEVVHQLPDLKKPNKILKACKKMGELEAEADDLYYSTIAELFKKEKDSLELVKKKDILQALEKCTDKIKDVSSVVKTIILKMA